MTDILEIAADGVTNPYALQAQELQKNGVVLDSETTGVSATDEIIELGIVSANPEDKGKVLYSGRFKPLCKVHPGASRIHGIYDSHLANEPRFSEKAGEIINILTARPVIAWNSSADKRFLKQTFIAHGWAEPIIDWVCIMKLYKQFKGVKSANLHDACVAEKCKGGDHSAVADALAAARILYRISQAAENKTQIQQVAEQTIAKEIEKFKFFLPGDGVLGTVDNFLLTTGWKGVGSQYLDPLDGSEREMNEAVEIQRGRM